MLPNFWTKDIKVSLHINWDVTQAKRRIIQRITNGDASVASKKPAESNKKSSNNNLGEHVVSEFFLVTLSRSETGENRFLIAQFSPNLRYNKAGKKDAKYGARVLRTKRHPLKALSKTGEVYLDETFFFFSKHVDLFSRSEKSKMALGSTSQFLISRPLDGDRVRIHL